MPRTAEQNQNIKDRRRSKLLSYALKVFALNGYDHTAVDDITKAAKCSHGLFYHYFDSKEDVFNALIDEVLKTQNPFPAQEALEVGGTKGLRVLAHYAQRLSRGDVKAIYAAKITFYLEDELTLKEHARKYAKDHDLVAILIPLIEQGQAEGKVIAGDAKAIAIAVNDMVKGSFVRLLNKTKPSKRVDGDILYGMLLKTPIED